MEPIYSDRSRLIALDHGLVSHIPTQIPEDMYEDPIELLAAGVAAGHTEPAVYPWCPWCSRVGATVVELDGRCWHREYDAFEPRPVVEVTGGSNGGGVALRASLGGRFSSPHEEAVILCTHP